MAEREAKFDVEARTFLSWVQACGRHGGLFTHEPESPEDLCDGQALFQILADIDDTYFRNPSSSTEAKGNWVLQSGTLKRLYKLVVQYLQEELQEDVSSLPQPDLNEIARNHNTQELCKLLRLVIAIPAKVRAQEQIEILQTLEKDQMRSIAHIMQEAVEDVTASTRRANEVDDPNSSRAERGDADISVEQSAEMRELKEKLKQSEEEKKKVELAYLQVLEEQRQLQSNFEDQQSERAEVEADLVRVKRELQDSQNNQTEVLLRQEVERLKADLRTSEDSLTEAEDSVQKLQKSVDQKTRKVEELQKKAEEAGRLKDQVDELKHSAEKVTRLESVVDKYKKKIEEGADVRRQVKQLEEENSSLINRNTALEDEYKRVSAFKPLMDSYKSQIQDLESKASNLQRDLNTARYDTDQLREKLMTAEEIRDREKEERELLEQRLEEIELRNGAGVRTKPRISTASTAISGDGDGDAANDAEGAADADTSRSFAVDDLGDELEDALDGTSVTDLRIRVHKLTRELEAAKANKADVSRILVLENLLDDSLRMKGRYEGDYLREHQAKLVLQSELDAIRNGKSSLGDGPEAAFALRKRLNETVDELDAVRKQLQELEVNHEALSKELTIAKSDLTLVNKDQMEILRTLRASVDIEKQDLDKMVAKLRDELRTAEDRNTMFMQQVNSLLMEKVDLQTEGITQREEALRRERNLGELRSSLAGKALPKEAEDFIAQMQINQQATDKQLKSVQDKFNKAKAFIKQQDRIIKDKERSGGGGLSDEQLAKAKELGEEDNKRLRLELRLIGSAYHELGLRLSQEIRAGARSASSHRREGGLGMTPASWLLAQRRVVVPGLSFGR
ncbi:unnamed protein product [Tilletia controversa]|uniref:Calponin-homology (CH) domain-containing protein n=3 Tax=Tilletia TaxID=13289 RepID=A0A8X7SWY0_9BASI|nr:hypothetical protein CF336_g3523 [Tilletia laevis]KAE8199533.1 hypothetical protein CF328_g3219 [Tilletia controversa]KAE8261938.1 hypothetical protein A4X03_0g2844 [Tilletia caries]KAE8204275.1 hypothetical protein CF335_g2710 [Tilletia laevis]KAE8248077.1 hypothetical protein A4X06_0g3976 [Tilletia controversa]